MLKYKYKAPSVATQFDRSNPWKFHVGQAVYVWGFRQDISLTIKEQKLLGTLNFPHYVVEELNGDLWTVPQMHLSRKPLVGRF